MNNKKPKILLISDDIRFPTGVASMAHSIMVGTKDRIDWVQFGGAKHHPENGTVVNVDGIKIYCSTGFGNFESMNEVLKLENPDGILLFTDPRFFMTQWRMEHEIRKNIPIMFYTIWDNYPPPKYNFPFYESCDGLFCISKQTKDIVEKVLGDYNAKSKIITYSPHGVNSEVFKPLELEKVEEFFERVIPKRSYDEFDFISLWSNKNMMRKCPMDAIQAYNNLCVNGKMDIEKTCMILNTNPILNEGTDLLTFVKDMCHPDLNVFFLENGSFKREEVPYIYNLADVVINNSNAEGFGLASAEGLMCGKPVISTLTGGLQDQMDFKFTKDIDDGSGVSLHLLNQRFNNKDYSHGEWVFPLIPDSSNLIGSPPTPYIYQDNVSIKSIEDQLLNAYSLGREELQRRGLVGREFLLNNGFSDKDMHDNIVKDIEKTLENFKPKYNLFIERF